MPGNQLHNYLERLGRLVRSDARTVGQAHGLQPAQLEALHYLNACNRYSDTPAAVTEYLGVTKGTASQSLNVLEKKGLIKKGRDNNDKRVVRLCVTAQGRRVLKRAMPVDSIAGAVQLLDSDEVDAIGEMLHRLLVAAQKANEQRTFGLCGTCRFNQQNNGGYFCGLTKESLNAREVKLLCREHEYAI